MSEPTTKAHKTAVLLSGIASIYTSCWLGFIQLPEKINDQIIPVLPFWALVTFGSYSLGTLGWGILTFKDKESKYHELLKVRKGFRKLIRGGGADYCRKLNKRRLI
jgi:dolichyl-phosphate mannosyltransferase polypeptide 3